MDSRKESSVRLKRLLDEMERDSLDAAIITAPKDVYYFTGAVAPSLLSLVHSNTLPMYLLVFGDGRTELLTSQRDKGNAVEAFTGTVASYTNYDLQTHMVPDPEDIALEVKKLFSREPSSIKRIGIESWNIPQALLNVVIQSSNTRLHDLSASILRMRAVKDQDELTAIRAGSELSDFAYSIARSESIPGNSEVDVYASVLGELVRKVGSYQFLAGDFASGERSLKVGGPPTRRRMKEGETIIVDLWLTMRGYWSDTCRTFVIGGKPSARQLNLLELLKRAMLAGEEKLRPGEKAADVYKAVFGVIAAAGLGDMYPHHAGHGIGLDDWESPFLIPGSNQILERSMVCTLEPGAYVPGVGGIRIEHNYLIDGSSPTRLTKYPLDL